MPADSYPGGVAQNPFRDFFLDGKDNSSRLWLWIPEMPDNAEVML